MHCWEMVEFLVELLLVVLQFILFLPEGLLWDDVHTTSVRLDGAPPR